MLCIQWSGIAKPFELVCNWTGARFQVFGDTYTTARLIMMTSLSDCIHLSEATANELSKAGKKKWITEREHKLNTEEKGILQTYWLVHESTKEGDCSSVGVGDDENEDEYAEFDQFVDSKQRWIQWNVETFKEVSGC